MDILSLFRSSPERQIEKLRKKVKEPHGDASVRINAAQRLFEMGTDASLVALLDRFTISVSPSIQDEQEKEEVCSWLVRKGHASIPAIITFLKNQRAVYWPAKALREILGDADFAERVAQILDFHWENPPASAYPKAEIIRSAREVSSPELLRAVKNFLQDDDDDVRLAAVEFLMDHDDDEIRMAILDCYAEAEDRPRIRVQILEHFAVKEWSVRGQRPIVEESLPEGFSLTRDGKVKKVGR